MNLVSSNEESYQGVIETMLVCRVSSEQGIKRSDGFVDMDTGLSFNLSV